MSQSSNRIWLLLELLLSSTSFLVVNGGSHAEREWGLPRRADSLWKNGKECAFTP